MPVWETECAFKWLDVAYQERDLGLPSPKADLRLVELVKQVGLPQYVFLGSLVLWRRLCSLAESDEPTGSSV